MDGMGAADVGGAGLGNAMIDLPQSQISGAIDGGLRRPPCQTVTRLDFRHHDFRIPHLCREME